MIWSFCWRSAPFMIAYWRVREWSGYLEAAGLPGCVAQKFLEQLLLRVLRLLLARFEPGVLVGPEGLARVEDVEGAVEDVEAGILEVVL